MDLFSDLPPAAGEDQASKPVSTKPKPVAASGWLMPPPPIRRPQAKPSGSILAPKTALKPAAGASTSSTSTTKIISISEQHASAQPVDIHAKLLPPALEDISNKNHEVYDPAKPNDYMAYCAERLKRKKDEDAKKELEKYMREKEEEQRRLLEERSRSGEFAPPVGRGRGRGVSNLPAWMVAGDQKKQAEDDRGEGGLATQKLPSLSPGAFEDAEPPRAKGGKVGIGSMLLAKMGYKEGAGLGKEEQGITRAIHHRPTGGGQGTIAGPRPTAPASSLPLAPAPPAASESIGGGAGGEAPRRRKRGLFSNPSRVLLLKNMVGPGEVDDDLQVETAEECQKFGPVKECIIHEIKDESCPEEERVLTFVFFEKQESAVKAYVEMGGRFFGGRQIQTSFFEEDRFLARDLVAS